MVILILIQPQIHAYDTIYGYVTTLWYLKFCLLVVCVGWIDCVSVCEITSSSKKLPSDL